ncbi:BLUF domain-containing protein [Tritonibacter litoralis]|nr:BLUF domain-containing protein [Tritonibacter litoralis]
MRAALRNNERDGITGFLLRDGNTYLNVVEGPKDKVEAMLARVANDPRAFGFEILSFAKTEDRQYPAWSMSYHEHNQPKPLHCPIQDFLSCPETHAVDTALAAMQSLGLRQISIDLQSNSQIQTRQTA